MKVKDRPFKPHKERKFNILKYSREIKKKRKIKLTNKEYKICQVLKDFDDGISFNQLHKKLNISSITLMKLLFSLKFKEVIIIKIEISHNKRKHRRIYLKDSIFT